MTDEKVQQSTSAEPEGTVKDRSKRTDARTQKARRVFAVIMIILLLLLCGVTALFVRAVAPIGAPAKKVDATGLEWIRSIYGYGKEEADQLSAPNDVAVDGDGTIWVTDKNNARVVGFAPDGSYRSLIHQGPVGSSPRAFLSIAGVDTDEDGNVWVCDFGRKKVCVYTPDNELIREIDISPGMPTNVAVRDGRVAIGSFAGFSINNTNGNLIKLVGMRGDADDEFDLVQGIYIDEDGTIYCTDTHNNRLKAFDRNGKMLWIRRLGDPSNQGITKKNKGQMSTEKESVQLPSGLTMDGAGRLVFVDPFEFAIVVADPKDGKILAKYGEDGVADGEFAYPTGIDYDAQRDWFAVADTGADRVQIVRIPGSGGGPLSGLRRMTTGWLKICGIPLLLLLVAAIATALMRRRKKTAPKQEGESVDGDGVVASAEPAPADAETLI